MTALSETSDALPVRSRASSLLRALLGVLGLSLLAMSAAMLWRHMNAPAPYRYTDASRQDVPPGQAQVLQVLAAENERVIAEAEVVADPRGPILLAWRAKVDEPMLYLPVPKEETQALAAVVARHRAQGTPVLAWWDTSRQLRHWGGGEMLFDQHLGVPLFVPQPWLGQRERVVQVERSFWGGAMDPRQKGAFENFARALVATEDEGVRLLRSLVPGTKAVIVLHVRDVLMLGELFPAELGVSFQDFTDSGDVHRSVRGVHGWLKEGSNAAYSVIKLPSNMLRAVALRDEASANTLVARLLPFIGNRQDDVRGLTLVYRSGGYSVFELSAADAASPP